MVVTKQEELHTVADCTHVSHTSLSLITMRCYLSKFDLVLGCWRAGPLRQVLARLNLAIMQGVPEKSLVRDDFPSSLAVWDT